MATFKETVQALEKWYHRCTLSELEALSEIDRKIVFLSVEVIRHDNPSSVRDYRYAMKLASEIEKIDSEYHKEFIEWMTNDIKSFYHPAQEEIDSLELCSNEQ